MGPNGRRGDVLAQGRVGERVVLDQGNARFRGQPAEASAAVLGENGARRVVEGRHDMDRGHGLPVEKGSEVVDDDAVGIDRKGRKPAAGRGERVGAAGECR
jgi:hypothetical protein